MAPWWLRGSEDEVYSETDEIEQAAADPEPEANREDELDASPEEVAEDAGPQADSPRKKRRRRRRKRPASKSDEPVAETAEPAARTESSGSERPVKQRIAREQPRLEPKRREPARKEVARKDGARKETTRRESPRREPVRSEPRRELARFDPGPAPVASFAPPPQSTTASDERRIAMLCDLENIALGVRDSEVKKLEVQLILERLLEKGKIIVKKAYADWERYSNYKRPFHEAAIELIDIPQKHYSGKNSADIKMVVDAMDLSYSKEHLDTFAIVSGDSDFSPLVSKLKENNKYVIGIGVRNASSNLLIDNCDEFIFYEDVWRVAHRGPRLDHLSPKETEVFGLMSDAILALSRENKEVLWGSMLKQTMQRKRPSFNESTYGYGSFSELLEEAERKGVIELKRDERSGSYVVTGFGRQ